MGTSTSLNPGSIAVTFLDRPVTREVARFIAAQHNCQRTSTKIVSKTQTFLLRTTYLSFFPRFKQNSGVLFLVAESLSETWHVEQFGGDSLRWFWKMRHTSSSERSKPSTAHQQGNEGAPGSPQSAGEVLPSRRLQEVELPKVLLQRQFEPHPVLPKQQGTRTWNPQNKGTSRNPLTASLSGEHGRK